VLFVLILILIVIVILIYILILLVVHGRERGYLLSGAEVPWMASFTPMPDAPVAMDRDPKRRRCLKRTGRATVPANRREETCRVAVVSVLAAWLASARLRPWL
jgi:hypothetical protein